jgi:NACHT domain
MAKFDVNVNEIAGHAAADLVESFFQHVGSATKDQIAKYKIRFGRGFSKYLTHTLTRYSQFKTLLNRYEPLVLEDHYVPARIRLRNQTKRDEDFFEEINERRRIVIEGTAGLGKTLFLRHLFAHTVRYHHKFIPVLFELRNLHLKPGASLLSRLTKQISDHIPAFEEEHLVFGLQRGKFAIFLDALDEIAFAERSRYGSEILDLSYRYVDVPLIISSRPDKFYAAWETFTVGELLPMTRSQTKLMLEKLKFEPIAKATFLQALTDDFFKRYADFLSIPLLGTLMMLTYEEFSGVPDKVHVFYEQAFQTLFQRHDSLKGAFSRKIESGLDLEQFRRVLSAFCFVSYLSEQFSLLEYEALQNIRTAAELADVELDAEMYLTDLLVTVCILQRDGQHITFVHRSFQEYFTALFVVRHGRSLNIFDFVERLLVRQRPDNVLRLVQQLESEVIEQGWVLPTIKKLEPRINLQKPDIELLKGFFGSLAYSRGLVFSGRSAADLAAIEFILDTYGDGAIFARKVYTADEKAIQAYMRVQAELAEKHQPHNIGALSAYRRDKRLQEGMPLSALATEIVDKLECVKDLAAALRALPKVRKSLEAGQAQRETQLKTLLTKFRAS